MNVAAQLPNGDLFVQHQPPRVWQVQALMDDFVDCVNLNWEKADPVVLASFVLWRLNFIHPFINGNGRTARALCYYVLCLRSGGWLGGNITLMELLVQHRNRYVAALAAVDNTLKNGPFDLTPLFQLVEELLAQQLNAKTSEN